MSFFKKKYADNMFVTLYESLLWCTCFCVYISVQNIPPPAAVDKPVLPDVDSALQEQERIITMSYALASEASLKSKQVAGKLTSSTTAKSELITSITDS